MKRLVFLMLVLAQFCWTQHAKSDTASTIVTLGDSVQMTLSDIIGKGLPVIYVETVEGEEPTCDYVSAPPGCMSASIANATKVPGRLIVYYRIADKDSIIYDSGDYEKDVSGMTIRIRGNKTAYDVKKPYKIKLQKKHDLLFRGNENIYKDKEWLLLRDDYLTTIAGFKINELVGMVWTPQHHFVNVVINGSYRGAYLLCESVKRNPDCRLNIDKNWGFIFELDPYWWNEDVYVYSSNTPSYNYTFKYPDSDDILPEQLDYMQDLVSVYEASLRNGKYSDLIDARSFAAWCLVHDILGTNDAGGSNMFYTKYDTLPESKIVMPLAWDFDMAERTVSAWSASHIKHMSILFNNTNDRTFVGEYVALWRKMQSTLVNDVQTYMLSFRQSDEGIALNKSFVLDKIVYGRTMNVNVYTMSRYMWVLNRFSWLNNSISALNPLGDVNVDGKLDVTDVTFLIEAVLNDSAESLYASDVNEDGSVNVTDVTLLIGLLMTL